MGGLQLPNIRCRGCGELLEAYYVDGSIRVDTSHVCEVKHGYDGIGLPINYQKALKEQHNKLRFHKERFQYHKSMVSVCSQRVEELIPFTNWEEEVREKNRIAMESSKEFTEIRKKVKKKAALELVDIMLQRTQEVD